MTSPTAGCRVTLRPVRTPVPRSPDISNVDNGGGAASTAYRLWCAQPGLDEDHRLGSLTNLGPNVDLADVTETSGSATISGLLGPSSDLASGDAVTGTGIPAGTTISSASGTTATLSNSATASGTVDLKVTIRGRAGPGSGYPIGIPIRIIGINTASGTEATFASYAESGVSGGAVRPTWTPTPPLTPTR